MKKIGIITLHFVENHGAVLQCIALSQVLKEHNYVPYVINYRPFYQTKKYPLFHNPISAGGKAASRIKEDSLKKIQFFLLKFIRSIGVDVLLLPIRLHRRQKFRKLILNELLLTKSYKTLDELNRECPEMDAYIAGSDQIWNTDITGGAFDDAYFLKFISDDVVKISYAASAGIVPDRKYIDEIRRRIRNFSSVSVRELSLCQLLSSDSCSVQAVCDPTFLPGINYWKSLMSNKKLRKPYILVYCVEPSEDITAAINIFGEKNIRLIDISISNIHLEGAKRDLECSPQDFLTYIYSAKFIIAGSFHATVFSLIMHKEFIYVSHQKTQGRVVDLLNYLGLSNRIYDNGFTLPNRINYKEVDKKIEYLKNKSLKFLLDALEEVRR